MPTNDTDRDQLLAMLRETGALMHGHFELTSGRHSGEFLLMAQALQWPEHTEALCRRLAALYKDEPVDVVIGPAVGGIILAYEVARHFPGARAIFAEKDGDGMSLRRGFGIRRGERVLVVEDAVSTGGSVQKVIDAIQRYEPSFVGVGALIDRSSGRVQFDGMPFRAVLTLDVPSYEPADCPLCRDGVALVKPKQLRNLPV